MIYKKFRENERGAALMEFAIGATVFLTAIFAVVECGRLLWTHNALKDAARRGARYAVTRKNDAAGKDAVKKMVVYGNPNADVATAKPIVKGLTLSNVVTDYSSNYGNGLQLGARATVSITNAQFKFAVPLIGRTINLPAYRTSLPGESGGFVPCDISSAKPYEPCDIIPN